MNYITLCHIVIMGIQAYIFGKRFKKDKKNNGSNECNVSLETDEKTIRHQKLVSLNKRLYDMYQELTQEQDAFDIKKQENTSIQETLEGKKCEVENRLQYLEAIRNKVGDNFKDKTTSIQDFKELCSNFVSTCNDIEIVQMEIHQSEIEMEIHLQSWNGKLVEHNNKVSQLRKDIQELMTEIEELNLCLIRDI